MKTQQLQSIVSSNRFPNLYAHREHVLGQIHDMIDKKEGVQLYGPVDMSSLIGREIVKSVKNFRQEQFEARSPWMLVPEIMDLDEQLAIDDRSYHFLAAQENTILSCLRLTPAPFESAMLNAGLDDAARIFENFFEVSRFLTRKNSSQGTARALLYKAAHWMLTETDKDGLFGICRPVGKKYFQRYGLKTFDERNFEVPFRPNVGYSLMWTNSGMMVDHMSQYLSKTEEAQKIA